MGREGRGLCDLRIRVRKGGVEICEELLSLWRSGRAIALVSSADLGLIESRWRYKQYEP